MRTLQQIACEHYIEHTAREIEVMEVVRTEAVADLLGRLGPKNRKLASELERAFWMQNPKGR